MTNEMKNLIPINEGYDLTEEFLYSDTYLFIKGYAHGKKLKNTLKALPLARIIHDGQHRKCTTTVNGVEYKLPYITHCLKVCDTLISLECKLKRKELDRLLTVALLHDSLEDNPDFFPKGGIELVEKYGFSKKVLDCIKLLSKRTGATPEELNRYFNEIKLNKLALLVKLSDRSHNVESMYSMKVEKIHKYIEETKFWIYPLCRFGKDNYPEISNGFTILKSKIMSLTDLTEIMLAAHETKMKEKDNTIELLHEKIKELEKELEKNLEQNINQKELTIV